jgi:hypothetical protein
MRFDGDRERFEVPRTVALDVLVWRDDARAVVLGGVRAFRDGFEFDVTALSRIPDVEVMSAMRPHRAEGVPDDLLRIGIRYADGRTATNLDWDRIGEQRDLGMWPRGGEAGGSRARHTFRVSPLPPPGTVEFVFEWPAAGLPDTFVPVDAALIRDAAAACEPVWPDS